LADVFAAKAAQYRDLVKPGRTHLQDAVPITFGQELGGWAARMRSAAARIRGTRGELSELGIGGTAAGTGLNADPKFRERVCASLAQWTGDPIVAAKDLFAAMQSTAVFLRTSSGMRTAAVELASIANDIRLLASGPRTGFGELVLPAVQPGSSIMPGKVNPAIAEMVDQVCFQVIGNDTAVMLGAQAGQLELNVMMPGINYAICLSATILANATRQLRTKCVEGMRVDPDRAQELLDASPSLLATALSPHIGYAKAAALMKRALAERRPLLDVAAQLGHSAADAEKAFRKGCEMQASFESAAKEEGRKALDLIEKENRIGIVLVGRPYNAFAKVANMGVPMKFASRGITIMPFEFLPFEEEPARSSMYWKFG
ncbi:MAG: lyase family protein, partial [Chloroflexota bacterium]